ncbi:type VI secretion system protein VasG [Limnobacter thiooxidans]|uniref:Type VI secretion system ATPase TssH n=1 Tax=Limnobacter thiooxidans TaxID=131080 RepID=A0AA86M7V2_9BURK|nr:type VI secretion system ATPase TssH [Limnobacter sp.]MCZ8016395.1 type VI secretion system ATPase TssH [Limnobacter sp.]RZS39742.1 type VI secretion system protein VasG [Limnobacter thiooxidans]BET24629.1 type VI secretion system ATPase TssH [Limnobacter thiooxidans]
MSNISRVSLFATLNPIAFKSVEGATVLCKLRGNAVVELVHWVAQILQQDDSDWHHILRHFELDAGAVLADVQRALERQPGGAQGISDLSESITNAVERAWVYASLMFGAQKVRTGHVLLAVLKTDFLLQELLRISPRFRQIPENLLGDRFAKMVENSPEQALQHSVLPENAVPGEASGAMPAAQLGGEEALKRYTVDLTEKARKGEIDPVTGRGLEVRQIVDILLRRRQNNPLITGEAGVGKTAVVEGFALQVVAGDVPPALKNVRILTLDLGLLQAGASMKGEFEQRLRQVIDEIQSSEQSTILFIDEVHTLVGAGGNQGTGDAANLLKPALARGSLRTIGATTWAEYKKYIEKDPALTRRFQVVQVGEPSETQGIDMLRGLAGAMQAHHRVWLLDEAVQAAVRLSHRYIPARQLPDKAISLLDTACARVAVSQHATPPSIECLQKQLDALGTEREAIEKETAFGREHSQRRDEIAQMTQQLGDQLEQLQTQWAQEKRLLDSLLTLRQQVQASRQAQVEPDPVPEFNAELNTQAACADQQAVFEQLKALEFEIKTLQGESPMIHPQVDAQCVAAVVADWTGIPVGRMVRNEIENVLNLPEALGSRIIGQTHALDTIARRIQTNRAGLDDPNKPVGVFMLAGTSGVGKTETALALAENLYGGEHNVITINMSEYQEAHTVSSLKGAPPGYVGYGEGGVLTEAVRRKPYSVVLLDEVEKAHPDVHELFFQVFDKGWMEDGEGRRIDFRNTLILLTTNVGTSVLMSLCKTGLQTGQYPASEELVQALRAPMLQVFPPALLGRLEVVPYYPLSSDMLASIVRLQLARIEQRISSAHKIRVTIAPSVIERIVARCNEADSGGRMVGAILSNTVLPTISRHILQATLEGKPVTQLSIDTDGHEFTYCYV